MGLAGIENVGSSEAYDVPDYSGMVDSQYDPVINYLQKSIGRTKNQGEKQDQDLKEIYAAMASGNKKAANKIGRRGDKSEDRIQQLGEQLAKRTTGNSERAMGRTIDEAKRLGLSHAADMATQDTRKNLARNQVYQGARTDIARNAESRQNSNWENYARAQSNISRMEGAHERSNLQSELNNLIFGLRGQIASTKSEAASAALQAQMQEDQMQMSADQAAQSSAMSGLSARAGMLDNYQGDIAQLMEAAQGGGGEPRELTGWDAISSEYRNYLKGSGQTDGAPMRNTDEVMNFMQAALANMGPTGVGEDNDAASFLDKLRQYYEEKGGYGGTGVPADALSRVGLPTYNQFYK